MKERIAALGALVSLLVLGGGTAVYAQATPDPQTVAAVNDGFDSLKTLVTSTLAPALFALTVLIIGITMGRTWLRKGSRTA